MIWRRWVTESSSSAPQTTSDHLDRRLSDTRTRPPHSGFVQVGFRPQRQAALRADAVSPYIQLKAVHHAELPLRGDLERDTIDVTSPARRRAVQVAVPALSDDA